MTETARDLVEAFFAAMPAGRLTADFFADEIETRSITSQPNHSAQFYVGGIALLQSQFPEGLHYTVDSVIAEGDGAAAQVRGRGVMADGREYANTYAFFFRFREGRISYIFEFFDPQPVNELIMPALREALAKMPKP